MLGGCSLNIHALDQEGHVGQFAVDLPAVIEGSFGRGPRRAIFDAISSESGTYNFVFVGIISDHDYTKVPKYFKSSGLKMSEN